MLISNPTKAAIESTPSPAYERMFLKYPTSQTQDITDYLRSNKNETYPDKEKLATLKRSNVQFTSIHTHPIDPGLSANDLKTFMLCDDMRSMVIALRDPETWIVNGYNVIKKTKSTPIFGRSFETVGFRWSFLNIIKNPPLILGNKAERHLFSDVLEYWNVTRFEMPFTNPMGDFVRSYPLLQRYVRLTSPVGFSWTIL